MIGELRQEMVALMLLEQWTWVDMESFDRRSYVGCSGGGPGLELGDLQMALPCTPIL